MAELSEEARVRLTDAERELAKKWGKVSGKLMAAYASALFIEGVMCPEHAVELLMQVIENLYASILPKEHPESKDEVTQDIDDFIVKLFSEHYPGQKFSTERDGKELLVKAEGGDGGPDEMPPSTTLH